MLKIISPSTKQSPQKSRRPEKSDVGKRGHAIYLRLRRRELAKAKKGKAVAIDVKSSDFALGETGLEASEKLLKQRPKANIWMERIGYAAFHYMRALSVKGLLQREKGLAQIVAPKRFA